MADKYCQTCRHYDSWDVNYGECFNSMIVENNNPVKQKIDGIRFSCSKHPDGDYWAKLWVGAEFCCRHWE